MEWQPIETAPKDGSVIFVRAVWGTEPDDGKVSYEGLAQWRTERRAGLIEEGVVICPPFDSTGWMRMGSSYRVPGRIISWHYADIAQTA